jgi:hypothetical protein
MHFEVVDNLDREGDTKLDLSNILDNHYFNISSTIGAGKFPAAPFLTKYLRRNLSYTLQRNVCHLVYWIAIKFTLYCLKFAKAFCKSRLVCAEIEVGQNVRHHTFSRIYILPRLSCHPTFPTFSYFSSTFLLFLFFIKNCLIFLLFPTFSHKILLF